MIYRPFGKMGYDVSLLSMGVMRLPRLTSSSGGYFIDREKSFELLRYAADNGINYFDTAYGYHAMMAEEVLGEALDGERRKKVKIATKQPLYVMKSPADIRRNLENSLKKLRTDYLDIYLIHGIGDSSWEEIKNKKIIEEFEKFRDQGMIRGIAFSYHGNYQCFKKVMEYYPWDMCQVQQNLLDTNREVTDKVYDLMANHPAALVIMEPLRGGGLVNTPEQAQAIYDSYPKKMSPVEWAFKYLVDKPEVSTILSGMSDITQLKENIALFSQPDMVPGCLLPEEKDILKKVKAAYESIVSVPCTYCDYCMPCPANVNIPAIFSFYNDIHRFNFSDTRRRSYMFMRQAGRDFTQCTSCGECAAKCPQGVDVLRQLTIAHEALKGWNEVADNNS